MEIKDIKSNTLLYDSAYNDGVPRCQLYVEFFEHLPSIYFDNKKYYKKEIIEYFINLGYVKYLENYIKNSEGDIIKKILLINQKREIFILLDSSNLSNYFNLYIQYNLEKNGELDNQLDLKRINRNFLIKKENFNINLMKNEHGFLDIEEFKINIPEINLELNYGLSFLKKHEIIIENLKTNKSGIILLHGEPGTGKTTYLKYLTKFLDKKIIFVPPSIAETLSDPSIIPFLMSYKNSVLIIEDGEKIIGSRNNNKNSSISNLLNLTDGILGDCLNMQVIVTFNMEKEKIDNALLRKGRLIAEHKFKKLSINDSNKLLKHLGKKQKIDKEMSLADIYYFDVEDLSEKNDNIKLGFKK